MATTRKAAPRKTPGKKRRGATVRVSLAHYQQLQRESVAARYAFEALNEVSVSQEELSDVVWRLWRALEGGVPGTLQ